MANSFHWCWKHDVRSLEPGLPAQCTNCQKFDELYGLHFCGYRADFSNAKTVGKSVDCTLCRDGTTSTPLSVRIPTQSVGAVSPDTSARIQRKSWQALYGTFSALIYAAMMADRREWTVREISEKFNLQGRIAGKILKSMADDMGLLTKTKVPMQSKFGNKLPGYIKEYNNYFARSWEEIELLEGEVFPK